MLYPPFIDAILRHHLIAFLIASRDLNVLAVGGTDLTELGMASPTGSLLTMLPELSGGEAELQLIAEGGAPALTIEYLRRDAPDGAPRYYAVHVVAYSNSPPGAGLLVTIRDVTPEGLRHQELTQRTNESVLLREQIDRKNLDLAAANLELRQLAEIKSNFVAVTAHELRNPLTAALGYLDLLGESGEAILSAEQRQMVGLIQNQLRRLSGISGELLDLARLEAGRMELHLAPTDLELVVRMVIAENNSVFATRDQNVAVEIAEGMPASLIDEPRIAQVIDNLLSNASKFTPPGGRITVRLAPDREQGQVIVSVSDTGVGIAPEDQDQLFQRFFRTRPAQGMGVGGTGLGLSIARAFVELHGGQIWCESAPGQGSTFYVSLPTTSGPPTVFPAIFPKDHAGPLPGPAASEE